MKLPQTFSWKFTFAMTVIIKLCFAFYLSFLLQCADHQHAPGTLAITVGDTFSYTEAMENYINTGRYYFYNGKEDVLAGRLPHYSIPYLFFRQFVTQAIAYDLLAILQIIIECLAIALLVILSHQLCNSMLAGLMVWSLCILSSNWTLMSLSVSPESLSCSFLVFTIFFYYQYQKIKDTKNLLLCSLCLGILVTLKSYFIIGFVILGISFLKHDSLSLTNLNTWKKLFRKTILASLPLIILLAPWIWRNYTLYHQFIPLQISTTAGYNYSSSEFAFRRFVGAWGGDIIYWEKTSAGCYFIPDPKVSCTFKMPPRAFTKSFGNKEVSIVRNNFVTLQSHYSEALDIKTSQEFNNLTNLYKSEKPIQYYLISPLRLLIRFVNHSGSYYMPVHSSNPCYNPVQLLFKIIQSGIYWISVTVGLAGLFLLTYKFKDAFILFFPLFVLILFPFFFRIVEWRYLRTIEPILYLGFAFLIVEGISLMKHKRKIHTN